MSKSFDDFINSLQLNSDEKYKEIYNSFKGNAPMPFKLEEAVPKIFDFSLNYSLELVKKYHLWLIENYNIIPKN